MSRNTPLISALVVGGLVAALMAIFAAVGGSDRRPVGGAASPDAGRDAVDVQDYIDAYRANPARAARQFPSPVTCRGYVVQSVEQFGSEYRVAVAKPLKGWAFCTFTNPDDVAGLSVNDVVTVRGHVYHVQPLWGVWRGDPFYHPGLYLDRCTIH